MENLEVMVILFIIVILGYVACKLGYMGDKFDKKLSSMVVDITCPLLVLSSVMGDELPDRTLILPLLGVGFLTYILLLVFGFWVPRLITRNHDDQGMIGFALMFANVGFIGYPIVSSIFGPKAIFYAALLNMPNTFFIFTAGVMLIKGEYSVKQFNPKVLFSPALLGAFVAALLVAFGVHTPDIIARPVTMVGNITVPAALMIIGSSMAKLPVKEIIGSPKGIPLLVLASCGSTSEHLFPVQGMWCKRSGQRHQYGCHCDARSEFRHDVLSEIRPQSFAHHRDDVHHHGWQHHHHPAHHPPLFVMQEG